MIILTKENALAWIQEFITVIQQNKDYLSELDTKIGDGDHGNNMNRGVCAVLEAINSKTFDSISDIFKVVAFELIGKIGGASGPLYGSAFMEMSKTAQNTNNLSDIITAGLEGIKKRGKSVIGEKTMIDVWEPVATAIKDNNLNQEIIDNAVKSTENMLATKGRASYLVERSIGHLDPGAVSSGYLFTCLLKII